MIKRDGPVILQPAAGLEKYHNFYDPKDVADYREILAGSNLRDGKLPENVTQDWLDLDGVRAARLTLEGGDHQSLLLHIHGGGFIGGVPCTQQQAMVEIQQQAKMDLISLDYGLAPEHPFPAGLEDCVKAYLAALKLGYQPEKTVLIGESAGGTLSLTTAMYLRDHGLPLPGALVLLSPLMEIPDVKELRRAYESHPGDLKELEFIQMYEVYVGDHDTKDPMISPKYGDFHGLPPMLIQCGGSEQMSPTLNMTQEAMTCAQKAVEANVDVSLHVWQYMFHVFLFNVGLLPESDGAIREVADYVKRVYQGEHP
jgi:acetyl esterase/lipase